MPLIKILEATSILTQGGTYEGYGVRGGAEVKDAVDDFGWNQEFTDADVNLTYLRNRFYHIGERRFITQDNYPIDNRYAYAKSNPIMNIDPLGHSAQQAVDYSLGAGFSILGVIGVVFAVPTGGASLTLSAGAGIGAGVATTLSGVSLMGSQVALDTGNKAAAKALQYVSIATGALAAVAGVVAIAPRVGELLSQGVAAISKSSTAEASLLSQDSERLLSAAGEIGSTQKVLNWLASSSEDIPDLGASEDIIDHAGKTVRFSDAVEVATVSPDGQLNVYDFSERQFQWMKAFRENIHPGHNENYLVKLLKHFKPESMFSKRQLVNFMYDEQMFRSYNVSGKFINKAFQRYFSGYKF